MPAGILAGLKARSSSLPHCSLELKTITSWIIKPLRFRAPVCAVLISDVEGLTATCG